MVLTAGDVALDLRTRRATLDGETIELSAREFALLELFLRHPDQVLSREQLLAHVWGYDFDPGSNVVEVYVGYLRRKLGADAHRDRARHGLPPASVLVVLGDAQDLAGAGVDVDVVVVGEADLPHERAVARCRARRPSGSCCRRAGRRRAARRRA